MAASFPPPSPGTLLGPPRAGCPVVVRVAAAHTAFANLPPHPPIAPPVYGPLPGWYGDPWRVAATRWWDGRTWTGHVWPVVGQTVVVEPPLAPLPLAAGLVVLGVLAVSLIAQPTAITVLRHRGAPLLVVLALSVILAYGPALLATFWVARRWTSDAGSPLKALAFRIRGVDIGWGLLTWLCLMVGNVAIAIVIRATHLPLTSNVRFRSGGLPRHLLVASTLVAVVVAPLVEELIFRGVVLRALRSVVPTPVAIGVQGVLFGVAHVQVAFGAGNLGLVLLLSWAGVGLGLVAHHFRRLGPSIVAHATVNTVVFLLIWLSHVIR